MNSLPLVLVNSAFVGKEQQCREGGTKEGENFNQGKETYYVRFLLNIYIKYVTNRHIQLPIKTKAQ